MIRPERQLPEPDQTQLNKSLYGLSPLWLAVKRQKG